MTTQDQELPVAEWLEQFDSFRSFINRHVADSQQQTAIIGSIMVGMGLALVEAAKGSEEAAKMAYIWADHAAGGTKKP